MPKPSKKEDVRESLRERMDRAKELAAAADQKFAELREALVALRAYAAEELADLDPATYQRFAFLGPKNGTGMGSMALARVAKFHGLGVFLRLPSEAYLSSHFPLAAHIPALPANEDISH